MDHNRLDDLYLDLAEEIFARIESWIPDEGIPITYEGKPNYGSIFWRRREMDTNDTPYRMESAARCARALFEAGILRSPVLKQDGTRPRPDEFDTIPLSFHIDTLLKPIADALLQNHTTSVGRPYSSFRPSQAQLHPSRELISESYQRYKKDWMASHSQWNLIVPLDNFTSDLTATVPIGKPLPSGIQLYLAPLTEKETVLLRNLVYRSHSKYLWFHLPEPTFKLTGTYLVQRDGPSDTNSITEEFIGEVKSFITALRLHKTGAVGVEDVVHVNQSLDDANRAANSRLQGYAIQNTDFGRGSYHLQKSELPSIHDLMESLHTVTSNQGEMGVALRRFNQAYDRILPEDKVIDLTITLESTLLYNQSSTSIKEPLSLYGAIVLAKQRSIDDTQQALRAIYYVRNKIVHDGKTLFELCTVEPDSTLMRRSSLGTTPSEVTSFLEGIVRSLLREYIALVAGMRFLGKDVAGLSEINHDIKNIAKIMSIKSAMIDGETMLWQMLRDGVAVSVLRDYIAAEIVPWFESAKTKLMDKFSALETVYLAKVNEVDSLNLDHKERAQRKELVEYIKAWENDDLRPILERHILDGNDYSLALWDCIKPPTG